MSELYAPDSTHAIADMGVSQEPLAISRRHFLRGAGAVMAAALLIPPAFDAERADAATTHLPEQSNDPYEAALITAGYWDIKTYQQVLGLPVAKQVEKIGPFTRQSIRERLGLTFTTIFPGNVVVVDLSRQVATYFSDGKQRFITRVTTGSEKPWTYIDDKGVTHSGTAITPTGRFKVLALEGPDYYSSTFGPEDGRMPYAIKIGQDKYNGIALHGGKQPGYPASHGCVRLPLDGADKRMHDLVRPNDLVVITGTTKDYRKNYL